MIPADLHPSLAKLAHGDCLFFASYAERTLFARLVMAGLARCYVIRGGDEYVSMTEMGREMCQAMPRYSFLDAQQ